MTATKQHLKDRLGISISSRKPFVGVCAIETDVVGVFRHAGARRVTTTATSR
jgi:hypothetical protein